MFAGATVVGVGAWVTTSSVAAAAAGLGLGGVAATDAIACRLPRRAVTLTGVVPLVLVGFALFGQWSRLGLVVGAVAGVWGALFLGCTRGGWFKYGDVRLLTASVVVPTAAAGLEGLAALVVAVPLGIALWAPLSVHVLRPAGGEAGWVPIGPGVAAAWLLIVAVSGGSDALV